MGSNRSVIANAAQQLGRFHLPPFEALPILMYHKNRRNLARSRVWRLVAESDEMIEAATNLESQVKALLASLTQWKARVANSLAGILSLPTELLQRIFTFVVSGDLLAPNQSITLSHVCSRWRRASVDLPALWVRLRLVPPKGDEALRELSQRARGAAIKLSIDFKHARPLNLERHVGPELVEKIAELSVMSSLGPSSMILPQHPPAKLIAFSETSNNSKPSLITSPSLSHIQRLEMRNVTFPISSVIDPLPFPYLTSISLSSVTSHHLIQFLRSAQAPLLHDLQIESSDYRYPSDPMPPRIFDSLAHLKIVDSPYMLPSLFWAFGFPNLETFHLEYRTHQPGMTGVTYDNSVRAVLKEFVDSHSLTKVTLAATPVFLAAFLGGLSRRVTDGEQGEPKLAAPQLEHLVIELRKKRSLLDRKWRTELGNLLHSALDARWNCGVPSALKSLYSLRVDESLVDQHKEWLQDHVGELYLVPNDPDYDE